MFLFPKPKTYKGKINTYCSIADSYRDDREGSHINYHAHDIYSKLGECYLGKVGVVSDIEGSAKTIREPNVILKILLKEFGYEDFKKMSFLKMVLSTSEKELT